MTALRRATPLAAARARLLASAVAGVVAFSANALGQGAPNPFPEPIKPEAPAPKPAAPKAPKAAPKKKLRTE